jgi:hypothetical protein
MNYGISEGMGSSKRLERKNKKCRESGIGSEEERKVRRVVEQLK